MDQQPTVGVMGVGTVGGALCHVLENDTHLLLVDPSLGERSATADQLVEQASVIFIAVPTPRSPTGHADVTAFNHVIDQLVEAGAARSDGPVLCVKSAVPPQDIARVQGAHPDIRLVVSPEFLRQRSPIADMVAMRSLVLGGRPADCEVVERLFRNHSRVTGPMRRSTGLDAIGAAFLKYQENCFLAMKVSFMNEFYDLFQTTESTASWHALQTAFHQDHERMGTTHWHVPGPDGKRGWGGHCLPKDVSATRALGVEHGTSTLLLDAIWLRNQTDRGA